MSLLWGGKKIYSGPRQVGNTIWMTVLGVNIRICFYPSISLLLTPAYMWEVSAHDWGLLANVENKPVIFMWYLMLDLSNKLLAPQFEDLYQIWIISLLEGWLPYVLKCYCIIFNESLLLYSSNRNYHTMLLFWNKNNIFSIIVRHIVWIILTQ